MDKRDVTIYDIAKEAGVSPSTVSRILTGSARVRPEKAERVRELILKYDFKPNPMARGLSETRSKIIGMLCADIANPYYASLFAACERAAFEQGYTLVSFTTMSNPNLERLFLDKLSELRVEAVILCGGRVDLTSVDEDFLVKIQEVSKSTPVVVAGKLNGCDCYQVCIDFPYAMDLALSHMLSLGHKDIAFLSSVNKYFITAEKVSAFRRGMTAAGLSVREDFIIDVGDYDVKSGVLGMDALLKRDALPTAVIAINDQVAAGAIQSIYTHGLRVPSDISVIGFDGTFITEATSPRLTSVANDYPSYGRMLVETAAAAIEQKDIARLQTHRPSLAEKHSCKKIILSPPNHLTTNNTNDNMNT